MQRLQAQDPPALQHSASYLEAERLPRPSAALVRDLFCSPSQAWPSLAHLELLTSSDQSPYRCDDDQ